jgi:hypothetical protein
VTPLDLDVSLERPDPALRRGRRRLVLVGALFTALFGGIGLRLLDLAPEERTVEAASEPAIVAPARRRPDLVDRRGELLATDIPVPSLAADPVQVSDPRRTAERLARILVGIDPGLLERRLAKAKAAGRRFEWVEHRITPVAQLAARLGLSPTEMLRRLLATQCHKPLAFQVSLQDGLLADRLQKWAGAVLLVFPAALALLVGLLLVVGPRRPTPDTPETAWLSWHGRLALVVIGGFLATALATGSTGHPLIGFLLVIWGLSLGYGLHGGHFTFHPRLGAGLLLAWGYLGGLAGIDLLAAQVGLPPDLVWPGRIWIIASFAAASLGLGLIGLLHLPAAGLPVVVSTKAGAGQRLTAFFLRGTWEAAAGLTLALAAAFGGIFWTLEEWDRRHPSPVSLPPPPSARPIPLLAPQISSDLVFQHLAVTPAPPGAPGIMAPSLSLPPLDSWLSRRASPSRFLLLRHRRRWTGRPIRRLEIILETRTFWDRVVDQLLLLPRTPMRLCQEARARCARFPCLDPDEQENEVPVLEALLGDLAQLLLDRIRSRQPLEAALKNALEEVFHRFSQFIYVDPTIKVHVRSAPSLGEAVPDPTEGDVIPLPFLETDSDQEMVPLTPDQLEQCFQPGGELLLTGPRGTAIFQIQPETFTLTRGVSFRPDLEIDLLEIRRRHPLILRLGF